MIFLVSFHYIGILIKFNFLFFQILIVLFDIFVFIVSFRESKKKLESSQFDVANIENLTH
jgi:hypothetical protein